MDMDDRFSNGAYIADGDAYPDKWAGLAAAFRKRVKCDLDLSYGESARQVLDIFHPTLTATQEPKGLVMFVHGGYWLAFDKSYWSHLAAGALARGYAVVIPSYDLCPSVGIPDITTQIIKAAQFSADLVQGPLRFTGHSAGGHLVARLAGMDWRGRLKRVLPISPVTDLKPLLQTKMNATLQLDLATARAHSPIHMARPDVPVTVWVGADERPVFIEQAGELARAWGCDVVQANGAHHFNVIEPLADPDSAICKALFS
ncbi:alpha/beta hydrolase [Yoonia sp. MH D7]